jgi:hypothetical protein
MNELANGWRPYLAAITPSTFQIQLASGANADDSVEVIDAQGKIVARRSLASDSVTLRGEDHAVGAYSIVVIVGGKRYVERWVNGR